MKQWQLIFVAPLFWAVFFVSTIYNINAQVANDTILASKYFKKGDSLSLHANHELSITFFKKSLSIYQKANAWSKVASCYNKISFNQFVSHKYEKSLVSAKQALEICNTHLSKNHLQEASAYDKIGTYFNRAKDNEKSMFYHKKALAIRKKKLPGDHPAISDSYSNLASAFLNTYQYEKALEYHKKSLAINLKNLGPNHIKIGSLYYNMGKVFQQLGEFNKAIEYYKKDVDITIKNYGEKDLYLGYNYNNIGLSHQSLMQYDKAMQYYAKALDIAIEKDNFQLLMIYNNIGIVFNLKGDYDKAIAYHKKSLEIRLRTQSESPPLIAMSYINLAVVFGNLGHNKKAIQYYTKALQIYKNAYGEHHPFMAQYYNKIATFYSKQQEYPKAVSYFDKALITNTKKKDQNDFDRDDFETNQYYDPKLLLTTLLGKAKTLLSRYRQNKDIHDLQQSIAIYKETDIIVNNKRQSFQNYKDKIFFAKEAKKVYEDAISAQLLLFKNTKKEQALKNAFYYAEKSKANILKELLNDSYAKDFTYLPSEIIEKGKKLKTDRAFYQSQIMDELSNTSIDSTKIKDYENELFAVNRKQDSLTKILEKNYPKYYQLKHQNSIISLEDIQKKLNHKTTLLEFFISDSITYAFTVSKNDITVKELSTPKLIEQVKHFRESITTKNIKNYKASAYSLYTLLIDPIKSNVVGNELIIIPDGPLWHLNFELLLTQNDNSYNHSDLSYLLKEYAISYANSANLLFDPFKNEIQSKKQQECLAFSFSDSAQVTKTKTISLATLRDSADDLPGTRKEIRAISDIIDGQYYFGTEAIESNFKENASQYNILHLALHGTVDNEHPENSKLYFTKSNDTLEDNLLYSHELFAMDIPAELTVLSACNTGTGKIAKGEGIMSLGNAFQYAGTKSLLLTSWEVSDQTTPELMKYFYTNLKAGMNKAEALQQAKLHYLKTTDTFTNDPFYWGGFYLVGDTSPIHFSDSTQLYWIIALGILGLMFFLVFWYRRKTER